jgi:hypothetical protein
VARRIRNVTVLYMGKPIPIQEMDGDVTAGELLKAVISRDLKLPTRTEVVGGELIRNLTQQSIPLDRTLEDIEDGETLTVTGLIDLVRTAGAGDELLQLAFSQLVDPSSEEGGKDEDESYPVIFDLPDEIFQSQQRFRQVIDDLAILPVLLPPISQTTEPEQVEGLITDYAWPDAKTRLDLEYLINQSADSATEILELLLEQAKRDVRQDITIGLKDRRAACRHFLKSTDSQRAAGIGELYFNEWAAFVRDNFLTPKPCPIAWQRMPLNLTRLIGEHHQLLREVWDFLNEQETQILDYQFKLQEIGWDTFSSLLAAHLQMLVRLEGRIDPAFLSDLLTTVPIFSPELPLLQDSQEIVLNHLSPEELETASVYEHFSERDTKILNMRRLLQLKARQIWLAVLDAWKDQAFREGNSIEKEEIGLFLDRMKNALRPPLAQQSISDELPACLKEKVRRNPSLLKQRIIAFQEKTLYLKQWELQLRSDIAEIRRKLLPLWIRSGPQELNELAKFIDESLDEFVADDGTLSEGGDGTHGS